MNEGLALKTQGFDFTMFIIVCAVLLCIAIASYMYAKYKMKQDGQPDSNIKVIDKKMINRFTSIYVVECDGQQYILTESSKHVSISKK
ncbi:flagellar biosynthetic protein FliO [Marinicellulosiphila megalodicopiae]|uniref:flagellar biosynthetic protein FliO n=1 Tax=Marinicellulosiphila megalodicopiae TaxID=2724896 RepID=UPI003BB20AB6